MTESIVIKKGTTRAISDSSSELTRRELLKTTAVLAGAVAVSTAAGESLLKVIPPAEAKVDETEQSYVQTSTGGLLRVYVKNGRVTRIDPVVLTEEDRKTQYVIEARGKKFKQPNEKSLLFNMGQAYRRWVYSSNRIRYPMKRVGWAPGGQSSTYDNRGLGEFVRIGWDEALDTIASEMKRLKETYGVSAILKLGSSHKIHGMLGGEGSSVVADMMFNKFGGTTVLTSVNPSQIGHKTGASFVFGQWATHGSFPQDYPSSCSSYKDLLSDTLKNSNLVVYWAFNGTNIQGIKCGHESEHHFYWITEAGVKTVSIAPDLNDTTAFHADKWIPVPAGHDLPLGLAIAHVWFTEDTWDKNWVATHAVGVEKFQDYVLGRTDGVPKSPEWAEKICKVKAREIRALAREWAKGPTMVACRNGGANRGWYGHEWSRLTIVLQALQGNIGRPGGNIWNACAGSPWVSSYRIPYKRDGGWYAVYKVPPNPVKQWIVGLSMPEAITKPPISWYGGTACSTDWKELDPRTAKYTYPMKGYSQVKMLAMQGAKLLSLTDIGKLAQSFRSPSIETFWLSNMWMEPLCKYADILLPATTNFERDDIGGFPGATGYGQHRFAVYMQKCIEPLFDSKDEVEIFVQLGKRLGFDVLEGKTVDQTLKAIFEWSSMKDWMKYEDFKKKGYLVIPFPKDYFTPPDPPDGDHYNPAMSWFYKQREGKGLVTPSGKIEIYASPIAEWYGENDPEISPIPKWYDPKVIRPQTWGNRKYPLLGMTDHPRNRYHSMYEDVAWLRETWKVKGPDGYEYEPIRMNPIDAKARGIKDEDIVRVYNHVGEVLMGARLTERLIQGTVSIPYGAFYDPVDVKKPSLDRGGSTNVLLDSLPISKLAWCEQLEHTPLQVEKWRRM